MTTAQNDNSIDAVLDKIVIWQYDESKSICALIDQFKQWHNDTTGSVWDSISKWFNLATSEDATDFSLALFGRIMGVPRLNVMVDGVTRTMSREPYRRILVAKFRLLNGNGSIADYSKFVSTIFGSNVTFTDNHDMSVAVEWTGGEPTDEENKELKYAFDNYRKYIFSYPTGVEERQSISGLRFWLAENTEDKPIPSIKGGGLDDSSFDWFAFKNRRNGTFFTMNSVEGETFKLSVNAPKGTRIFANDDLYECVKDGINQFNITIPSGESTVVVENDATWFSFYDEDNDSGCESLISMTISGNKINSLESSFRGCSNLESVYGFNGISSMTHAFHGCSSLTDIGTIEHIATDFSYLFCGCGSLSQFNLSYDNVKKMDHTFDGCISITEALDWPSSVTSAVGCYKGCTAITTVKAWGSSLSVVDGCYSDCTSITSVPSFNGTNISSADYCYSGCTSLATVGTANTFWGSLTHVIGMFSGCASLTSKIEWSAKLEDVSYCFEGTAISGTPNAWNKSIINATGCYKGCTHLTSMIAWNEIQMADECYMNSGITKMLRWNKTSSDSAVINITSANRTFSNCSSMTSFWTNTPKDVRLMPPSITYHEDCVLNTPTTISDRFTQDWGGTKVS